jgi:hypothetical protein
MKDDSKGHTKQKKPYTKPEVKQIPLRPEEAVLGFCKVTGINNPVSANCSACASQGS